MYLVARFTLGHKCTTYSMIKCFSLQLQKWLWIKGWRKLNEWTWMFEWHDRFNFKKNDSQFICVHSSFRFEKCLFFNFDILLWCQFISWLASIGIFCDTFDCHRCFRIFQFQHSIYFGWKWRSISNYVVMCHVIKHLNSCNGTLQFIR